MNKNKALLLVALTLCTYAANAALDHSTVEFGGRPLNASGDLIPNSSWAYNWVFSDSNTCSPVSLNISDTLVADRYGVVNKTLNLSSLSTPPAWMCEYRNGTLRKVSSFNKLILWDIRTVNISVTGSSTRILQQNLSDGTSLNATFDINTTTVTNYTASGSTTSLYLSNGTIYNATTTAGSGTGNTTSDLNNKSIPKWNGSSLVNSTLIDNGSSLIVNNLTITNYTFVGRGATGGNPLRLFPVDEQYGYTQIAFYPEANTSHKEGDVLFNIHKIEDPSNATHRHMSIYTTGDTFTSMKKRLDIDYGTNFSNFTIQNTDQFKVYADSLLFSSVNTNVFNTERVDWGEVRLDYDETTNTTTFNFNLQANHTNNSAQVRLFRESTIDNGLFIIYKGDNSTNKTFTVYANTGDIRDVGNISTSTGSVNDNRTLNLNGGRALVGYNGSSTYAFLQGGSGKGINLQTDGANSRINITPNGNVTIDGSTFFVNAGSDEVNMTANVGVRGSLFVNNTQVCLQNGTNCPAGGAGNVTATNGTAGYVGVFSSASNLVAMLINSTMIGDSVINKTHLNTNNAGSSDQVLAINTTGGIYWKTDSTGSSWANTTGSNGTSGYAAVWSNSTNLLAMLINSTMIGDAAVNATHLYTSNSGSNGQVLTLNSTGGMNWSTPTTGTSTSGGNASINGDGVFGTYTIQKNTTEIVSGNLTENGVLQYPNNATFSKYLNIGGTIFPYNQPRRFKIAELEFLRGGTNTGGIESLALTTFSSGASAAGTGDANHPGVLILQDSATALGGSGIFSDVGAFLLAGGENFTVIFQIRSGQTGNSTTKIGFHDVAGAGWATDGCYWSFDNWGTGTGGPTRQAEPKCASNSAQTKTTNFTYTNNTWYVGNIYVDPTATNVTFTIMNETGGVLQSDSITSNIPTAAGRETGAGVIFTQNTTSAAAAGVYLDYLSLVINRELNRGLQQ